MSLAFRYRVMYRLGLTPWDDQPVPGPLKEFLDSTGSTIPGRALDLGCGTGRNAVYLAERGWAVTGVDAVPRALGAARRRAYAAGVDVRWVEGDVTSLPELGIGADYRFVLDLGCFHGLGDAARQQCASGVTRLAAAGASLLLLGFQPGRRGPGPRGISQRELLQCFGAAWELKAATPHDTGTLPRYLRGVRPTWYRLEKPAHDHPAAASP